VYRFKGPVEGVLNADVTPLCELLEMAKVKASNTTAAFFLQIRFFRVSFIFQVAGLNLLVDRRL
jgi:hypothetical protein